MATEVQIERRKLRRTANACVACRQSKIKCSGNEPCNNCRRRALKCRFVDGGNRIMVTERYIQELERRAGESQQSPGSQRSPDFAFSSEIDANTGFQEQVDSSQRESTSFQPIDHARSIWTSPFTLPSRTIRNTYKSKRNWIWLAPSSVWSFTARLSVIMSEKLNLESPYTIPNVLDKEVYPLTWRTAVASDEPPDVKGLPAIDHALYLLNAVKFHFGQNYRLFEEDSFVDNMREFYYGDAVKKATESPLWFVQFLLVLAFGNAFLLQTRNPKDPPGAKFFVRAMSLMPDHASLWKDSLMAIEVLALAALYLYSIDHRESAHVHLGQAIRIAQMEGLHTQLPEDELGVATVARCRNLWWTLYIMDRHFSSSIGLPMTTQDSDITTVVDPPNACSQRDATLSLQVRLSHLLSLILTSIYKTEKTQLGTFLEKTGSILHTMAGHAQEIERAIHLKFHNSVDTMSKGTRHITLLYHQCVIVATRPLLLSVVKERLEKLGHGEEDWQSILAPTKALISTGIKSAAKTLQILTDEDNMLEVFLPFDLEFTYGAAIHLTMANTLFPPAAESNTYSGEAHSILDEMISKGNKIAEVRKTELSHLESLFNELAARVERRGLQTLTLNSTPEQGPGVPVPENPFFYQSQNQNQNQNQRDECASSTLTDAETMAFSSMVGGENQDAGDVVPQASNLDFMDSIGISSGEFLSIVDQIGYSEGLGLGAEPGWMGGSGV